VTLAVVLLEEGRTVETGTHIEYDTFFRSVNSRAGTPVLVSVDCDPHVATGAASLFAARYQLYQGKVYVSITLP
jgi:hypothetical protein